MTETARRVPPRRTPPARTAPTRSGAPTADEYEEEPEEERRPRSRRSAEEEPEEERSSRRSSRGGDEEEDDKPAIGAGWGAFNKTKERTGSGDFPDEYKIPALGEPEALFKFLDGAPFATFAQHWVDDVPGKKSWICVGDDCPLCDIGENPSAIACFNVIDMEEQKPKVKMLVARITVANKIASFAKQPSTSPIDDDNRYWAVGKSGNKKKQETNIRPVKKRDLKEDFQIDPLTDDELDELTKKMFTAKNVPTHSRSKLKEVADLATGRD